MNPHIKESLSFANNATPPTSFEANLRGKYKKIFSEEPETHAHVPDPPAPGPIPEGCSTYLLADVGLEDVTLDKQRAEQNTKGKQKEKIAELDERSTPDLDGSVDDNEDDTAERVEHGGDPPGADGWHQTPVLPRSPLFKVILHDGNSEWMVKHGKKFPLGSRGPEGYIWGRDPEDLLWAESAPGYVTRCSISQLYALGIMKPCLQYFGPGQEYVPGATPLGEQFSSDPALVEILTGKPTLVHEMPYGSGVPEADEFFFSIRGPERLNIHIPFDELPLTLDVYDADGVTDPGMLNEDDPRGATFDRKCMRRPVLPISEDATPLKYRLVDPTVKNVTEREGGQVTHATLVISKSRQVGSGHSARVFEGQIGLETPRNISPVDPEDVPRMQFPPKLTVIAKVGTGSAGTAWMKNEAKMYTSFPECFSREYTRYQLVRPSNFPQRLSQIVPHYYGFYEPVEAEIAGSHGEYKRAPIILMEDCGNEIDPDSLTQYQKAEIVSLLDRLHNASFLHQSIATRNILIAPGVPEPGGSLTSCSEWGRSLKTPTFRLVDFGRTKILGEMSADDLMLATLQEKMAVHTVLKMHYMPR